MLCGDLSGKEIQKRWDICIYIVDSPRCIVETKQYCKATILQFSKEMTVWQWLFFIYCQWKIEAVRCLNLHTHTHQFLKMMFAYREAKEYSSPLLM